MRHHLVASSQHSKQTNRMELLATDESASLQELLAAVDDWLSSPRDDGCLCEGDNVSKALEDASKGPRAAKSRGTKRPRERNTAVDMTRTLKKKAERAFLELQARDLEAQLARLRRWKRLDIGGGKCGRQAMEMQQAVGDNRALRARLARNAAMLQSISGAVENCLSDNAISDVTGCKVEEQDDSEVAPTSRMIEGLKYAMEKLPPVTADTIVCNGGTTVDAAGCPRFEIKTVTTLSCNVRQFSSLFTGRCHSFSNFARLMQDHVAAKSPFISLKYSRDIHCPSSGTLLHLRVVAKMFEQEDRVVCAWSTQTTHPIHKLSFEGRGWVVVTPSPQSPESMSCYRSFYELTPQKKLSPDVKLRGSDLNHVRSFLLGRISERMQLKHKQMVGALLVATGRSDLAVVLGLPLNSLA